MVTRRPALIAVCLLALLALSACGGDSAPREAVIGSDGRATLTLTNPDGKKATIKAEIADTVDERSKGLSGRESLDKDAGMLFVIEKRGTGFYMKDTLIPLSVAFIGPCGEIVGIAEMQPNTLDIHRSDGDWRYGLEANGGWFTAHGIGVGAKVTIPKVYLDASCPSTSA